MLDGGEISLINAWCGGLIMSGGHLYKSSLMLPIIEHGGAQLISEKDAGILKRLQFEPWVLLSKPDMTDLRYNQ